MEDNDIKLPEEKIRDILVERSMSLAVAESVTCGNLQAKFASVENTRKFFQGGITVYNLGQKCRHLKVEPIDAEQNNCVSLEVAKTMAVNVAKMFLSDVGIGITGYAAPIPELGIEKLFAYYAISVIGKVAKSGILSAPEDSPAAVQKYYCERLLPIVLETLEDKDNG